MNTISITDTDSDSFLHDKDKWLKPEETLIKPNRYSATRAIKYKPEEIDQSLFDDPNDHLWRLATYIVIRLNKETPLFDLELTMRTYSALMRSGVTTIGNAFSLSFEQFNHIDNFGKKAITELLGKRKETIQSLINTNPDWNDLISQLKIDEIKIAEKIRLNLPEEKNNNLYTQLSSLLSEISNHDITEEIKIVPSLRNRINEAINDVGLEICKLAFNQPKKIREINQAFIKFIDYEKHIQIIHELFSKIPESRRRKKLSLFIDLYPMIKYYDDVNELFISFENVEDIDKQAEILADQRNQILIRNFLEWLSYDINELTNSFLSDLLFKGNRKNTITLRAKGLTLEAVSRQFNVTRERIRQVEADVFREFPGKMGKFRFLDLVRAELNGEIIITNEEILQIAPDSEVLIYLLKKQPSGKFVFSKRFNCFYLAGTVDWKEIDLLDQELPTFIFDNEIESVKRKIIEKKHIPEKILDILFRIDYIKYGSVWHKGKLNKSDLCGIIIDRYFPNGIKLYDKGEIKRFSSYLNDVFGNHGYSESPRSLWGTIQRICTLYDRGVYISPSRVNIPEELLAKIEAFYLNSGRTSMSFHEMFEKFKDELLFKANITNRYQLQGVFKRHFGEKYFCYRNGITTDENFRIDAEIEAFIQENSPVNKIELKKGFTGMTEAMLTLNLGRIPSVILLDNGTYIHADELNILEEDYGIRNILASYTAAHPVTASKVLEHLFSSNPEFLQRNNINSPNVLFGVLQFMFSEEFTFTRPYIGKIGIESITKRNIIHMLIEGVDEIKIPDLIAICDENRLEYQSSTQLLSAMQDDFYRVDEETLVRAEKMSIDENILIMIKNILSDTLKSQGFITFNAIDNFIFYPDIGYQWTSYLLQSIINKHLNTDFYVLDNPEINKPHSDIVVDASLGLGKYEDVVMFALRKEHQREPFNNLVSIIQWLIEKSLVKRKAINNYRITYLHGSAENKLNTSFIPKFLSDDSFIFTDDYGKLIIS